MRISDWSSDVCSSDLAQDEKGVLRIPHPEMAAKFLFSVLKDPLHLRCMLGVQSRVSQAEIAAHVDNVVDAFLEHYRKGCVAPRRGDHPSLRTLSSSSGGRAAMLRSSTPA